MTRTLKGQWTSAAMVLGLTLAFANLAHADSFGLPNYAIFGTQSVSINDSLNATTTCVSGNVGTGGTAAGSLGLDKCFVNGTVYTSNSSVLNLGSNGGYSVLSVGPNGASGVPLFSVAATMASVSNSLNGLTPNLTLSSLVLGTGGFQNFIDPGGTFVVDITGNFNLNGATLNLMAANTSDLFVFNIGGTFGFSQSIINLSGIAANNVIFNVTDACGTADINKGTSIWRGTLLAPNCDIRAHNSMDFQGSLFAQNVTVDSGIVINGPTQVPEPSSLLLLSTGLLGLPLLRRRFRLL